MTSLSKVIKGGLRIKRSETPVSQGKGWKESSPSIKGQSKPTQNQLEIEDKIDEALANIKAGKIDKATESLNQGKIIIHKRKKLIRIADREDWATANEFRDDDLASNSEEDKKLRRAIKSIRADKEKSRKKAPFYPRRVEPTPSNYSEPRERSQHQTPYQRQTSQRRSSLDSVLCYHCQRLGHFANNCPKKATHVQSDLPRILPTNSYYKKETRPP